MDLVGGLIDIASDQFVVGLVEGLGGTLQRLGYSRHPISHLLLLFLEQRFGGRSGSVYKLGHDALECRGPPFSPIAPLGCASPTVLLEEPSILSAIRPSPSGKCLSQSCCDNELVDL